MNIYINKNGLIEIDETVINKLGLQPNNRDVGIEFTYSDFEFFVRKSENDERMTIRGKTDNYHVRNSTLTDEILSFYDSENVIFAVDFDCIKVNGSNDWYGLKKIN